MILGVDPGPAESALLEWSPVHGAKGEILPNELALERIGARMSTAIVCEWIHHMGMPAGAELFDTCRWVGRFQQAAHVPFHLVNRRDVKLALCGSARANDATIRQALIDRYGGKATAIGNKRAPGPLYGIKSHLWSALAVAVAYTELHNLPVKER